VATLFAQLKAAPGQRIDRVLYLAAKTSGRQMALDALALLAGAGTRATAPTPLRVLELVARDKACEHPGSACHGQSCPLALGFFDRLDAARGAALDGHMLTQGLRHGHRQAGRALRSPRGHAQEH